MPETIEFIKMQAAGNDFVLLDAIDGMRRNWPALARRLCAPHFGIGADGLLVLQQARKQAAGAQFRMRMFNPDGSEDMCGNGLLCVAAYLRNNGYVRSPAFLVETLSGVNQVMVKVEAGVKIKAVSVSLGPPKLRGRAIPVAVDAEQVVDYPVEINGRTIKVTALSTGTPHAVVFSPREGDFEELAPLLMSHPFFPQHASVNFARVEEPTRIVARVWERGGVGESLSCGTGAAAILAAAHLKGLAPREADVVYPGGALHVRWDCNENLWISGPVHYVFEGRITEI